MLRNSSVLHGQLARGDTLTDSRQLASLQPLVDMSVVEGAGWFSVVVRIVHILLHCHLLDHFYCSVLELMVSPLLSGLAMSHRAVARNMYSMAVAY